MKKSLVIIMVTIASIAFTAGVVKAAGVTADWLRVGVQGEGGVTYFNGTIINETTGDNDADNPVTFGDNVRIDGRVYRGATAGTADTLPFIVNDNMEVTGTLTVAGLSGDGVISTANIADGTIIGSDVSSSADLTINSLTASQDVEVGGSISWGTRTGHVSVSPPDCIPSINSTDYSISALSLYPDSVGTFYCPVHLPDGVTVTQVDMVAFDNNDQDIWLELYQNTIREDTLGSHAEASLTTSGKSSVYQVVTDSSVNFVVDNENYTYNFHITFYDGDYSLRFSGLVITYTYTEPH